MQKLPKTFPGTARPIKKVGVDGIDGFMGNAIGWLALEAGYEVVGHVPLEQFAAQVAPKLKAKYGRAVKKGAMSEDVSEITQGGWSVSSSTPNISWVTRRSRE